MTRQGIMRRLELFNQRHGIGFFSKQDATDYYRELVDLILDLTEQ